MIGRVRLSHLPRAGSLHIVQTTGDVGWTAGAMTGDSIHDTRIAVGPSAVSHSNRAMLIPFTSILTAPLGIERLLTRRLQAWVERHGTCPQKIMAYGAAAGDLAHASLPGVDRIVHLEPPADAQINCARTAIEYWRRTTDSQKEDVRRSLGISPSSVVILVGGDRADSIDARAAFAASGRAVLGGADVVLIVPARARWVLETKRHARISKMADRFLAIDGAEIPSSLWLAADAMLLQARGDELSSRWWGWCRWWALAAGIGVIHESCIEEREGTLAFTRGDRDELVRLLIKLADDCSAGGNMLQTLSEGAIRSAQAAAANR